MNDRPVLPVRGFIAGTGGTHILDLAGGLSPPVIVTRRCPEFGKMSPLLYASRLNAVNVGSAGLGQVW
jgi:hypothetical protein